MAESSPPDTESEQTGTRPSRAWLWRVLALLSLGALAIGLLFFMPAAPTLGRWRELRGAFMDWLHVPFFFAGTLGLYLLWPWRSARPLRRLAETATLAFVAAAATEIIQPMFGRSGTWVDLLNGTIGITGAAVVVGNWPRTLQWRLGAVIGVLALATLRLWPVADEWRARQYQAEQFPVLGDFESPLSLRLWHAQGDDTTEPTVHLVSGAGRGESVGLRVMPGSASWPGVYYLAGDMDWSAYRTLVLHIRNPGEPFSLSYRIDDAGETIVDGPVSRYHGQLLVPGGWHELRIDLTQLGTDGGAARADLSAVRRFVLFRAGQLPEFLLDDIHLE